MCVCDVVLFIYFSQHLTIAPATQTYSNHILYYSLPGYIVWDMMLVMGYFVVVVDHFVFCFYDYISILIARQRYEKKIFHCSIEKRDKRARHGAETCRILSP